MQEDDACFLWLIAERKKTMKIRSDFISMSKLKKHSEQWFENGFHDWIWSSYNIEMCRRHHKKIPEVVKAKFEKSKTWLSELTDEEYSRLIH